MPKLCIKCGKKPATLPDRNKPGRPIKCVCSDCHGKLLAEDFIRVPQAALDRFRSTMPAMVGFIEMAQQADAALAWPESRRVLAGSQKQFEHYMREAGQTRTTAQGKYIGSPHQMDGLPQGFELVCYGTYDRRSDYHEIMDRARIMGAQIIYAEY